MQISQLYHTKSPPSHASQQKEERRGRYMSRHGSMPCLLLTHLSISAITVVSRCGVQKFETRQIITINYRYLSIHPVTDSTMEIWKKGTIIPVPKKGDELETSEDTYICHQSYRKIWMGIFLPM